jgi:hypothetical protein
MNSTTLNRKRDHPKKPVWEHFIEIQDSDNIKKRPGTKCNFCKQQWACGKSSNIVIHLVLICPVSPPPEIQSKFCEILCNGDDSNEEDYTEPPKK